MPELSAMEVSPLLAIKRNRSYEILVDVSDAKKKDTFPNIALLGRIGTLSMGDQPPPRTPAVA